MVYVDAAIWKYGRMIMCHMKADTKEELLEMADKIGVARKWIQDEDTYLEHFDICKSKRNLAIKLGAKEISRHELGEILERKKKKIIEDKIQIGLDILNMYEKKYGWNKNDSEKD